jgi:hypothetical protein
MVSGRAEMNMIWVILRVMATLTPPYQASRPVGYIESTRTSAEAPNVMRSVWNVPMSGGRIHDSVDCLDSSTAK